MLGFNLLAPFDSTSALTKIIQIFTNTEQQLENMMLLAYFSSQHSQIATFLWVTIF